MISDKFDENIREFQENNCEENLRIFGVNFVNIKTSGKIFVGKFISN